jgi:hypothetical protein
LNHVVAPRKIQSNILFATAKGNILCTYYLRVFAAYASRSSTTLRVKINFLKIVIEGEFNLTKL